MPPQGQTNSHGACQLPDVTFNNNAQSALGCECVAGVWGESRLCALINEEPAKVTELQACVNVVTVAPVCPLQLRFSPVSVPSLIFRPKPGQIQL